MSVNAKIETMRYLKLKSLNKLEDNIKGETKSQAKHTVIRRKMSTNYDLYGREHMSLGGHRSVKIFDFMVFLYKSQIFCAFSLAFNIILTLTLQE